MPFIITKECLSVFPRYLKIGLNQTYIDGLIHNYTIGLIQTTIDNTRGSQIRALAYPRRVWRVEVKVFPKHPQIWQTGEKVITLQEKFNQLFMKKSYFGHL